MSKLQEKPSALKREHPALPKNEFYELFSKFVGHFCPPGSGYGSKEPIESDPQHCFLGFSFYGYCVCTGRAAVLHYCADWVRVGLHQAHSHQQGEEDIHDCPSPTGLYGTYIIVLSTLQLPITGT
jgi:hypothetical protein